MKKLLFAITLMAAMFLTSCEKENESQVLSEFIVGGEWVYDTQEELQSLMFIGEFYTDGTYSLILTDGTNSFPFDGDYNINNDQNQITLDQPDIEQTGEEPEKIVFDVQWTEGVEQMVWAQVGDPTNVLDWTRN